MTVLLFAQVESVQYNVGERTARVSAAAVLLNSKQLISLAKALVQMQPASSSLSGQRDWPASSPAAHASAVVQHGHSNGATSTDSPSSSIFDTFASSPVRSRHGVTSPVKSPSKLSARAPSAALPTSPAHFAASPARILAQGSPTEEVDPTRGDAGSAAQTARRRPTLSPLILETSSPTQPQLPPASRSLPGVFVPRASPASSGESPRTCS
jgi:hypothetical protein